MDGGSNQRTRTMNSLFALAITCIMASLVLLIVPNYFPWDDLVTIILSSALSVVGVAGLGIELNRLNEHHPRIGLDNLGVGLSLVLASVFIRRFLYSYWLFDVVAFCILFFGLYSSCLGVVVVIRGIVSQTPGDTVKLVKKFSIVVVQIAGFFLTVLQILYFLRA